MANNYRFKEFREKTETDSKPMMTALKLSEEFKVKGYYLSRNRITALENKSDVVPNRDDLKAYCEYFHTTSDYLLGFTSIPHGKNEDLEMIERITGLSYSSIEMLKILINFKSKYNNFIPALGTDIDVINILLEYEYNKAQKAGECIASWSIFHYIRQYLSSGIYEREQQDNIRVCDGKIWFDLKKGDILIREKKEHIITDMEALNSESGGGSNTKKLNVINTKNPNERYNVEVNKMFQSYSRDNILAELDKIKTYIEKKKVRSHNEKK